MGWRALALHRKVSAGQRGTSWDEGDASSLASTLAATLGSTLAAAGAAALAAAVAAALTAALAATLAAALAAALAATYAAAVTTARTPTAAALTAALTAAALAAAALAAASLATAADAAAALAAAARDSAASGSVLLHHPVGWHPCRCRHLTHFLADSRLQKHRPDLPHQHVAEQPREGASRLPRRSPRKCDCGGLHRRRRRLVQLERNEGSRGHRSFTDPQPLESQHRDDLRRQHLLRVWVPARVVCQHAM